MYVLIVGSNTTYLVFGRSVCGSYGCLDLVRLSEPVQLEEAYVQAHVSHLKQQLEQLFPGKWLTGAERSRHLLTGLPALDGSVARGIARRRISEWVGPISSGKTSLLKSAIANWCAGGLNVAYIDAEGKLFAPDWAFTDQEPGKFWIVRPPEAPHNSDRPVVPLLPKRALIVQEALWSADQFIRCNAFDVVVLDLGTSNLSDTGKRRGLSYSAVPSRIYARLQRSLDRSQAALIVVRDIPASQPAESWGATARFNFDWGTAIRCEAGLAGNVMITPSIKCNVVKDGLSQIVEVTVASSVQNRLFTHPQVPDRRTSKG
jgi:hypothetical protein